MKTGKIFLLDIIFCTLFVTFLIWGVLQIPIKTDLIDPIGQALDDFEATDLVYTALRDDPKPDPNITMVNIGNLDRAGVARLIDNLNKYHPFVIGIDAFYRKDKTDFYREKGLINGDSLLEKVFSETENLVLVTKLSKFNEKTGLFDSIETSHPKFMQHAYGGFANMITSENEFRVSRKVVPVELCRDSLQLFFPVKIASIYNPIKVEKFLKKDNIQKLLAIKKAKNPSESGEDFLETIYYRGNINNFSGETDVFGKKNIFNTIDVDEALNETFDPKKVTGKILLLGYMGEKIKNDKFWDEDKFYTPLNKQFAGKSFPDMYGVTVHANVVSMILNETYVSVVDDNLILIINLIICLLNVIIFSLIFETMKLWWDGISVIITLAESLILLFISLYFFEIKRIQVNFEMSILFLVLLGNFLELYYEYARPGTLILVHKIRKKLG